MKATGITVLGILIVICFGLLLAFAGPGNSLPTPQGQQDMSSTMLNADHQVDLAIALGMIKNYRVDPKQPSIKGGFFARSAFDKILAQPGCVGIRYYYAQKDDGSSVVVLVGVDEKNQDIQTGYIAEGIWPCPPFCGVQSELTK